MEDQIKYQYRTINKNEGQKHCFICRNSGVAEWTGLLDCTMWCKKMRDMRDPICEDLSSIENEPKLF